MTEKRSASDLPPITDTENSLLVLTNSIVMLGHVAVALKETAKTTESVLHFLQQRVGKMPPVLDILIVDQLACIVIAKCEVDGSQKLEVVPIFTFHTKKCVTHKRFGNVLFTELRLRRGDENVRNVYGGVEFIYIL